MRQAPHNRISSSTALVSGRLREKTKLTEYLLLPFACCLFPSIAQAQSITPAPNSTGTIVTPNGNQIDITGGQLSGDRANLFHNFSQFGLSQNQIANFLANPALQNILASVVGGNPSLINGTLQVTGSNANLFLVNPAGIVFGASANLNVPAAFTATTASGIGFGNQWLNPSGTNVYDALVGSPTAFAFATPTPGAIVNAGNLSVAPGQNLTLLGGTVVNTGQLNAPDGQLIVGAVPGTSLVRVSQPGSVLSLDLQPLNPSLGTIGTPTITPLSLPQLLTGGSIGSATGLQVDPQGQVQLVGSGLQVTQGDVASGASSLVNGKNVLLSAHNHVTIDQSQLQSTGNLNLLAQNAVRVRDSVTTPVALRSSGNLTLRGNQGIDILALNHPQPALQSGGNLSLISDGIISGDSHFVTGGQFSILNSTGGAGNFISLYDPIIQSSGDVIFGDYVGAALKIVAAGSIIGGNITITSPDSPTAIPTSDPDFITLTTSRALILQAGSTVVTAPNVPITVGTTTFSPGTLTSPGNISVGNIDTSDATGTSFSPIGGPVLLSAQNGSVTVGAINTSAFTTQPESATAIGGRIAINAGGDITIVGAIDTTATISSFIDPTATGGLVDLSAGGNILFNTINTRGTATQVGAVPVVTGTGGDVSLTGSLILGTGLIGSDTIATNSPTTNGQIRLQTDGGVNNIRFTVGNTANGNGTAGAINGGPGSTVNPGQSIPGATQSVPPDPDTFIQGDTQIRFVNSAPPDPTAATQAIQTGQTAQFTASSLFPAVPDVNGDNFSVQVTQIAAGGTLLRNGTPIAVGATIAPTDVLEFVPATGTLGTINAFSLRTSDNISLSNITPIQVTVSNPPPPPPPPAPTRLAEDIVPREQPLPALTAAPLAFSPSCDLVDPGIAALEGSFSDEFDRYSGQAKSAQKGLVDACNVLARISAQTGVKPALVYVNFVPETVSANGSLTLTEGDEDPLEIILITAKGKPVRRLLYNANRAKVLATAKAFTREVTDPRKTRSEQYKIHAQQLYQWIVAPIAANLQAEGVDNLVFIMDGGLRSLPLAALHDGKSFIIEKYSVGLMPSLSLTNTSYVNAKNLQVLGLGISASTQDQQPLPAVPTELQTIVQKLWSGTTLLNEAATLRNLRIERTETPYGIVHMATHADFTPASNRSYIQLWNDKLRPEAIRDLDWNNPPVELLVLSACKTAIGNEQAELGFAGSASQIGVKTVLASLWYVNDAATTALMVQFYSALKEAPIKAEALRRAQVAMALGQITVDENQLEGISDVGELPLPPEVVTRDRILSHPYYWASFTMVGNPW
jgi:filamentous hemagglutinin family protein